MKVTRILLKERFRRSLAKNQISLILGQRQIGKTTFIKDYLSKESDLLHINFDLLSIREELKKFGLQNYIESFYRAKLKNFTKKFRSVKYVFIDEAQKLPEIFEEIKVIYDEYQDQSIIKFILSGSSSLDLYSQTAESLAGRVDIIHAYSFNLFEAASIQKLKVSKENFREIFSPDLNFYQLIEILEDKLKPNPSKDLQCLIEDSLLYGSLPEICKKFSRTNSQVEIIEYLESYRQSYIEKDIRSLKQVGNLDYFTKLFDLLSSQAANLLNKNNLCTDLGVSFQTITNYLSVLRNTFIIDYVEPYSTNIKTRIIKSPKIFIFDNGFISLRQGFQSIEQLQANNLIGKYFENFIYYELLKQLKMQVPYLQICFYRTVHDAEIDFVLDYRKKIIPIEVKWADQIHKLKLQTLKEFINKVPGVSYGVVIYNGVFKIDKVHKIIYLPVQYLVCN